MKTNPAYNAEVSIVEVNGRKISLTIKIKILWVHHEEKHQSPITSSMSRVLPHGEVHPGKKKKHTQIIDSEIGLCSANLVI